MLSYIIHLFSLSKIEVEYQILIWLLFILFFCTFCFLLEIIKILFAKDDKKSLFQKILKFF